MVAKTATRVHTGAVPGPALQDRVRLLIDQAGQTQEAFGASVGLDATKLSKALNGRRRFSSLDLARIAAACGVTVDWLLTGDESAIAARTSTEGSTVGRAIREAANLAESRDNLIFLGTARERPKPPVPHSSLWTEQGLELAAFALQQLGPPTVIDSSEKFPTAIERAFGIDVRVMQLDGGCDGLALTSQGGARVLLVATTENPTRQRFTMAHELAHLLCRDDQELHVDENVMARSNTEMSEVRANAFAAALLMPESLLRARFNGPVVGDKEFAQTVMELMVSPSSLAWRLLNLGLLSAERRAQLGSLRTIDCASIVNRVNDYAAWVESSSQERVPVLLVQDLFQAYLDGQTTLRPLANLLQISVELLRQAVESGKDEAQASEAVDFAP